MDSGRKQRSQESKEKKKNYQKENRFHKASFIKMVRDTFQDFEINENTILDFLFNLAGFEYDRTLYFITKTPNGPGKT